MSSYSPQIGGNNRPNKNINEIFLLLFIILNGFSTGGLVRTGREMINNGADNDGIMAALMWLGCTIYTAQRAYELYKKIHKDDNNTKQR